MKKLFLVLISSISFVSLHGADGGTAGSAKAAGDKPKDLAQRKIDDPTTDLATAMAIDAATTALHARARATQPKDALAAHIFERHENADADTICMVQMDATKLAAPAAPRV